jgi:DNA-binding ferritin-like protein
MNIDSKVNLLLGIHTQLKIFHWQTKGYARHKSFGNAIKKLEDLMDDFIEESMGKYGRFTLNSETDTIKLFNLSELKPNEMLETICQSLIQLTDEIDPVDTNLLNIRDEILGLIQKLKYQITLE